MKTKDLKFSDDITVTLLADSINPNKQRLMTFMFSVPNIIHAEMMRHRAGSFSVSSNRAIPTNKLNNAVYFMPVDVGYNEKGMQATERLSDDDLNHFQNLWRIAYESVLYVTRQMELPSGKKVHKQHLNRLTMPFQIPTIVMTITEPGLKNFLIQRNSEMAQPEIHDLAVKIEDVYSVSKPTQLEWGDWHIPFLLPEDHSLSLFDKLMLGTARSARTSYRLNTTQLNSTVDSDIKLATKLLNDYHLSPFEHSAMAFDPHLLDDVCRKLAMIGDYEGIYKKFNNIYRNVPGFMALRPVVEFVTKTDPGKSMSLLHAMVDRNEYEL